MCSVILCESKWNLDPEGSGMSAMELSQNHIQDPTDSIDPEIAAINTAPDKASTEDTQLSLPTPQYVTRQDSGVPEDLASPYTKESPSQDDTEDQRGSSTGIHASETLADSKDTKDGSDSGVEGCTVEMARTNGYSSSCNGLDEVSCDSSLVSCCSVYEDTFTILPDDLTTGPGSSGDVRKHRNGEATSEGGSESSSVAGSTSRSGWATPKRVQASPQSKKKSPKPETPLKDTRSRPTQASEAFHRFPSSSRSKTRSVNPRVAPNKPSTLARERTKPREKSLAREGNETAKELNVKPWNTSGITARNTRTRSRPIPDSLTLSGTSALTKEIDKDLAQRGVGGTTSVLSRCPSSASRGRSTPSSTPSEECRKPLSTPRSAKTLARTAQQDSKKPGEGKNTENKIVDLYATLPRRSKGKMTLSKPEESRISRETSLNRMDKARKRSNESIPGQKASLHCPKSKHPERTLIYHETGVQTGLTLLDIEKMIAGIGTRVCGPEVSDFLDNECQTDDSVVSETELKRALERVKEFTSALDTLKQEKEKLEEKLSSTERMLTQERSDHTFTREELQRNSQRVLAILGTPSRHTAASGDSLRELESHFQESGQVVAHQQNEIADLQSLCRMLNRDLEKSLAAQKALLQHQQEVEVQTMELQEFLQLEKTAMSEAMKDVEVELKAKEELLAVRESELERKAEECKHLVRISEQRRQENLSLEMKLTAVERRSRELLLTQGAAVSGAAVALSGLGSRLEGLVEQLVQSYKISEKDLEDVVYHNEAYSRSNSSAECSPISSKQHSLKDFTPSPKRNSFVSAVIGAIKNAATHPFVMKPTGKKSSDDVGKQAQQIFKDLAMESSADLLDFETEPCLMMESVLEDVPLADTYSRNMISSSDSLRRALSVPEPITNVSNGGFSRADECSSLTNLTQAILHRRRVEEQGVDDDDEDCDSVSDSETTGHADSTAPTVDYCTAVNLVDQVIDVDNFVTKLLKVLRIIQMDNDTYIRELRDEKLDLEGKLAAESSELNELKTNSKTENDNTEKEIIKESEK